MIPRTELEFMLDEICDIDRVIELEQYAHLDREQLTLVLNTIEKIGSDFFASSAAKMDEEEPNLRNGVVVQPEEAFRAIDAARDAGLFSTSFSLEEYGLQLPHAITACANAALASDNTSMNAILMLTAGSARLIANFADENVKSRFLEPMVSGRFTGTMCLSEPHAGSSLSQIRTTAFPQPDGSYSLTGQKMWITGGDHELAENIVHLVLARIEGAPEGVKGISLFVVPKFRLDDKGGVSDRNDVTTIGLNHKMGYRGVSNALLSFGDVRNCQGFLVGEENQGMSYMFQMMNELRVGVGATAAGVAIEGARQSRGYAVERVQGTSLDAGSNAREQVAIIQHPDVRRMLLAQRSLSEGALALSLYAASLLDDLDVENDAIRQAVLQRRISLITPLVKSWPSEHGIRANDIALQVLGGAGYTRDFSVERLYRDNRLNAIHEGTTGIQALDLLHRKVVADNGLALEEFLNSALDDVSEWMRLEELEDLGLELKASIERCQVVLAKLLEARDRGVANSVLFGNATPFMDLIGCLTVAWLWLKMAHAALVRLKQGATGSDYLSSKVAACRYFITWELPRALSVVDPLQRLDNTWSELEPAILIAD